MVGMAARIRESSVTLPSSRGTLKSTRTKTRLPETSTSRIVILSMGILSSDSAMDRTAGRLQAAAAVGSLTAIIWIRSAQRQL
jgi:hypothetical protein